MRKEIEKIKELSYNEIVTLKVIEGDVDLNDIFTSEVNISYPLLTTLSLENKLSEETKEIIRGLFKSIILTKEELINKYLFYLDSIGETITKPKLTDKIGDEVTHKQKSNIDKKDKTIPRRYGKEKILKDIESQGGKPTTLQRTMLRVNDLKNIYVNLSARGVKDMVGGTNLLSESDCKDIQSAIKIMEQKLHGILKRK